MTSSYGSHHTDMLICYLKHESPARELLERLREVALERRADAGIARPSRRKKAGASGEGEDG